MTETPNPSVFDIRAFGAVGDGATRDTRAVQEAIDRCSASGGGTVLCPPGRYCTGTIELKDDVDLHLVSGATLLASPDRADYRSDCIGDFRREGPPGTTLNAHFICAVRARRIAITGRGAVDGNGPAFFGPVADPNSLLKRFSVPEWRPGHMIGLYGCEDVLIRDVRLVNSPFFTVWPYGCRRLRVEGVTIRTHPSTPNGDGINPDCCQDVRISNCTIDTADDCIALKSMGGGVGAHWRQPCENVTITNCVLRSCCHGVRLGVEGDNPIRNIAISNLVIKARAGISFHTMADPEQALNHVLFRAHGTPIENVVCSNLRLETTQPAFIMHITENSAAPGCIRGIRFDNILVDTTCCSTIFGAPSLPVEDVHLSNMRITVHGAKSAACESGALAALEPYGNSHSLVLPHAIYGRYVRGLEISHVRVDWREATGPWESALRLDDAEDVIVHGFTAAHPPGNPRAPVLRLSNVRQCSVSGARARPGTAAFVCVEGSGSADIALAGNDLRKAARGVVTGDSVPAGAVHGQWTQE